MEGKINIIMVADEADTSPLWKKGDIGYIDGYTRNAHGYPVACAILNGELHFLRKVEFTIYESV